MYLLFVVFCCKKQEPSLGQVTVLRVIWFLLLKANRLSQGLFYLWQYRIILSADTASEVRQLLSQKRR